jgi:TolA-binding protein
MRVFLYPTILASTILCQPLTQLCTFTTAASAQSAPMRPVAATSAVDTSQPGAEQSPLTEKQIEAFIAAQKTISAMVDTIPEDQFKIPNPQLQTTLDQAAKKFDFKDYGEYEDVANNIDFVMEGFDEDSKAFVGQEVVLKKQLSELAADRKMSPREKSDQIKELKEMLKAVEPVKFPNNIVIVAKYYDRLSDLLDDEKQ